MQTQETHDLFKQLTGIRNELKKKLQDVYNFHIMKNS